MKNDAIVFWTGVGVGVAFGIRVARRSWKEVSRSDTDQRKLKFRWLKRRAEGHPPRAGGDPRWNLIGNEAEHTF